MFEFNWMTETVTQVCEFQEPLESRPCCFATNAAQTVFVVGSERACVFYDVTQDFELRLDDLYHIDGVQSLLFDEEDEVFYLLCN